MSVQVDKDGTVIFSGWENGIAPSPHKGVGNLQNINLSTIPGEAMMSYPRTLQTLSKQSSSGTVSPLDSSHVLLSITSSNNKFKGTWITVTGSTISGLSNADYFVHLTVGSASLGYQLSTAYNGSAITGLGATGTATFTIKTQMGIPLASAVENYSDGTNAQHRYYILDNNGYVWTYDTANEATFSASDAVSWFLPDNTQYTSATGVGVLNGWLLLFGGGSSGNQIYAKPTVYLGASSGGDNYDGWNPISLSGATLTKGVTHFAYTGHQGRLYYTDGKFIGSIFPNTSLLTGAANIQSYAKYTASTTTGTIATLVNGSYPVTYNSSNATIRVPAMFFTVSGGTQPTNLTKGVLYYIEYQSGATFQVFAAAAGGAAINIQTGAAGSQYFNTFSPVDIGGSGSTYGEATYVFTPQRLNLPSDATATCMAEAGNTLVIGMTDNTLFPWDQVSPTPDSIINLPENNTVNMLTVNNFVYVFAGNKGNIYISNGSVASRVLTVPDYCAQTIEPYFTWGGAAYIRGRVYFSIQDQTASKTGNCGGVWSFTPTQNFFIGQDVGLSLVLENQSSYGTYNGYAPVIIASFNQAVTAPQYWSAWVSSVTSPVYGIDFTSTQTGVGQTGTIETDIAPVGDYVNPQNYSGVEIRLAAALASGDTVQILCKTDLSFGSFTSVGTLSQGDTTDNLAIRYPYTFANVKWIQLQAVLSPATTGSSFCRVSDMRVYKQS